MEHRRASYSAKEKMEIVLSILSKQTNIHTVSQEKGIAATLISLWKKQALEAMEARLQPQPKGRRKVAVAAPADPAPEVKAARKELRAAKIRASHLENSVRETRAKLAQLQEQVGTLAATMGCKLVAEKQPRRGRKPGKADKA